MHDAIRNAIERGDYTHAAALWEQWACDIGETRDRAEWAEMTELYRWARQVLLCSRAQLQDRYNTLGAARAYVTCP